MEQHSTRPRFQASFTLIGRRNITNVPVVLAGSGYNCGYFNIQCRFECNLCDSYNCTKIQCDHNNYTVQVEWPRSSSQFLTNTGEERIFSCIKKNKTPSRSSLSLSGTFCFYYNCEKNII